MTTKEWEEVFSILHTIAAAAGRPPAHLNYLSKDSICRLARKAIVIMGEPPKEPTP